MPLRSDEGPLARTGPLAARVQADLRPASRAAGQGEAMPLTLLGLLWAGLWLLTVPIGNFPLDDDWVYALAVRSILETGRYALPSPATANVFAQAYWGALFCVPFGFSFTALRVSTFVLGTVGVLTLYLFLRELGAERRLAGVGALTLAVNPLYLCLADTFMTDVPFTALVTVSLWLYVRGVRRGNAAAVAGGFAVAFVAILVRQFALMLPLAYGVAHLVRKGIGLRSLAIATLPILAGAALHVGYERWVVLTGRTPLVFSPVTSLRPASFVLLGRFALEMSVRALPYFGLFLFPFLAGVDQGRTRA
ncbi:MAG: glycosyltransferase family 39 protein, partial [Acetobacteraceae bacterium]|nr:glycosyltransferase family 39 protein [Acetobacteraceae bacterium]